MALPAKGSVVADIGGGNGSQLISLLQANPTMRGILFDLPHVIERASETAPTFCLEHLVQRAPCPVAEERNARLVRPVRSGRFTEDERGHRALRGEERGDMCAQDASVR